MTYRTGSYRWFLHQLHSMWSPRGIFMYTNHKFKLVDWHKEQLLIMIRDTRRLLDGLEAKITEVKGRHERAD